MTKMMIAKKNIDMINKEKDYFSTRDAADLLNVAVSTIQLWMDNGLLSGWSTAGGHRRIEKKSVEKMLNQRDRNSGGSTHDHPVSIVVVEDNEQEQMLYDKQFKNWNMGVNVCIAKNGYSGLINIGKTSPKIIITDLMMAGMNGFEMIKAIKTNPDLDDCQIIVLSALTNDEIKTRGGLPADVLVFNKPMPFNELEIIIRNQMNSNVA